MFTTHCLTAMEQPAQQKMEEVAMTQATIQLTTSQHYQQAAAAEMMQVNSTSLIIMGESAQAALMTAYGAQEIPKRQIQAMQNGGATCMNGMSA